ncbi:MAG: insulinase family protein, partial [Caulobacteraceae bacterium]|nr:insulinase family protein [Caulobacter sp.]
MSSQMSNGARLGLTPGGDGAETAAATQVVQGKLDNGLDIVVIPDHRAPVVTHMVWYRNGSADDPLGKSGIAHFLEHLMFKGTAKNPAGKFSELVSDLGGQENAFTSNDFTAYFQRIPKEHLAVCMEYEADRMKNLVLTDEVVAPERDVVLEERRMRTDSDPGEILDEAIQAAVYTSHPYGKPVIGWAHEIESLDRSDAFNYYERFYTPENAILIVAGDVEPEATIALAKEIYGPIAPFGAPPRRVRPQEPRPTTHRQVSLADDKVEQPRYQRMHLVPSYRTAAPGEAEAIEVLAFLLGGGQTSLLFKTLVMQDKVAVAAGAHYMGTSLDET